SADGKLLASGGGHPDASIRLWERGTGKQVRRFDPPARVYNTFAVAFSPDGKTLASAHDDRAVRLWDLGTGKERVLAQGVTAGALVFSPGGTHLLSSAGRWAVGERHLWDLATGQEPAWSATKALRRGTSALADKGKTLVIAAGRAVRWWDLASGT